MTNAEIDSSVPEHIAEAAVIARIVVNEHDFHHLEQGAQRSVVQCAFSMINFLTDPTEGKSKALEVAVNNSAKEGVAGYSVLFAIKAILELDKPCID